MEDGKVHSNSKVTRSEVIADGKPVTDDKDPNKHNARNYKEGVDDGNGPNMDAGTHIADGDTTANSGIGQ